MSGRVPTPVEHKNSRRRPKTGNLHRQGGNCPLHCQNPIVSTAIHGVANTTYLNASLYVAPTHALSTQWLSNALAEISRHLMQ